MFSFISLQQKHCCQNEENPSSRWRCFSPHAWRSPYYVLLIRGHPHHVRTFRLEVPLLPLHISRCALRSTVVGSQNPGHLQSRNRGRTWIDSSPPREREFCCCCSSCFFSSGAWLWGRGLGCAPFLLRCVSASPSMLLWTWASLGNAGVIPRRVSSEAAVDFLILTSSLSEVDLELPMSRRGS